MSVVDVWTGRHASALRKALRLTNEAFAQELGTATRTVAKWNALPKLVPVSEMQRALDTMLQRTSDEVRSRFAALLSEGDGNNHLQSKAAFADISRAELQLAHDPGVNEVLSWLDQRTGWPIGETRRRVAARMDEVVLARLQDRAQRHARIGRENVADALAGYYGASPDYLPYRVRCADRLVLTSILTRHQWLDVAVPLGTGRDRLDLQLQEPSMPDRLSQPAVTAVINRIAESVTTGVQIINTPLYQLLNVDVSTAGIIGTVGLTDFITYALTMDLLEAELIDALVENREVRRGKTSLRDLYLPDLDSVTSLNQRLCAGGPLALFAAARPQHASRRGEADYVLLVQERSGRVLNSAQRLAVIPKAFHEPLNDFSDDAQIPATLEREMEEELFGRSDVDSTVSARRVADPLHLSRLSPPMRWLMDHSTEDAWHMECTGFGLNLVSGNFEFASLIVVDDESWWSEYGGHIEANWEYSGLRRYSSLDHDTLTHLVHDASWSNEGLFAFVQGVRRLAEHAPSRVKLPPITLES